MMDIGYTTAKKGHFYFDPDDPIYREHFPGHPVVPGSLIVHAFVMAIGRSYGEETSHPVTNFRFKRFVSPGCYAYRIEPKSNGRMACFLYDEEKTVVTGTL
jgi:3-hydroxyacyl-[acyl-carrier-protein] dehydratase